jgi:hypothetical protein
MHRSEIGAKSGLSLVKYEVEFAPIGLPPWVFHLPTGRRIVSSNTGGLIMKEPCEVGLRKAMGDLLLW